MHRGRKGGGSFYGFKYSGKSIFICDRLLSSDRESLPSHTLFSFTGERLRFLHPR